jgi:hypothetical protein
MKTIGKLVLLYAVIFLGINACIRKHQGDARCTRPEIEQNRPGRVDELKENSATYDGHQVLIEGVIVQVGNPFFDLFFLSSCKIESADGTCLRIFTGKAIPATGCTVRVCGTFRQFSNNFYLHNWCGVLAEDLVVVATPQEPVGGSTQNLFIPKE